MFSGDREMRAKNDFLVDGVDAVVDRLMRRRQRNRLSFPVDFSARTDIDSGEHFDERRFAGAILTDDRVDFACLEFEINGLEGVCGAEALVELLENEKRRPPFSAIVATLLRLVHRRLLLA